MTADNFMSIKFKYLDPLKTLAEGLKTIGDDRCVDKRAVYLKRCINIFLGGCPDEFNPLHAKSMENAISGMRKAIQENWGDDRFDFTDPLKRAYYHAIKNAGKAQSLFLMDAQQAAAPDWPD